MGAYSAPPQSITDNRRMMKRGIDRILKAGETVELVVYPQWRWLTQANIMSVLVAVLLLGVVGKVTHALLQSNMQADHISLLVALLPFWGAGIGLAISPFWRRKRVMRTLYVVTNRRAIVVQPSPFLLKPELRSWPLNEGLIKSVYADIEGTGDIIFDYRKVHTKHGFRDEPEGFLRVPELDRVHKLLQEQIAAVPADAEPPLPAPWQAPALPPVPPAKRTSWKHGFWFITPGLFLCLLMWHAKQQYAELVDRGVTVSARVVEKEKAETPRLTVAFKVDKFPYRLQTMSYDADNARYNVGDVVKVVYLPDKVHVIDLKSLLEEKQKQVSILLSLGGALILIGGVVCVYLYRKESFNA